MSHGTIGCIGCGGLVPDIQGPTHRYMESSPGCWQVYGELLAREYSDPAFFAVHRLTTDTYAVQHPGRPSPQSIQSVCGHLMSLCVVLDQGRDMGYARRILGAVAQRKDRFRWLTPPRSLGKVTVVDVAGSATAAEHGRMVRRWAEAAWSAWAEQHGTIRGWISDIERPADEKGRV
jgi:hypothetical protein